MHYDALTSFCFDGDL